jgi:2-polyprenyl-6-methoxyphenol hydroxylase-like FAD-dependent oxidoreductase
MADVLVVGAGPVGLTMAAELARHGVRCRIVEKLEAPSGYCKAIGVTPRTLEVWEDMGVARVMIDAGLWLRGLRTIVGGKTHEVTQHFPDLPYGHLGIPQYDTERILAAHLAQFGVTVERGVALDGLRDAGGRVAVALKAADGLTETTECRFVVGCDGAHSAVRHALGIGFPGDRFPMEFMLGDVAIHWDVPRGIGVFAIVPRENTAPDFLVAIPLPALGRYRVSMLAPDELAGPGGAEHGISSERPGPSLEQLQAVADRLLPGAPRLSELRWSSLFGISMRVADKYRVGNVFIAGDAAHIHPPTGGQGMNTGIQDAYNLAWKMALVLRDGADARLLDSYEAERRPVGAEVVERTRRASMSFGRERASKENRLADTQILVNYRDSVWIKDAYADRPKNAVRAGDRAPDADGLRRDQVGFPFRLFDLLRGTDHVLVVYLTRGRIREWTREVEALARDLADAYGPLVRVVAVAAEGADAPEIIGATLVQDAGKGFARAYAARTGLICLVRPDGYIAYMGNALDRGGLFAFLEEALGRLAARVPARR